MAGWGCTDCKQPCRKSGGGGRGAVGLASNSKGDQQFAGLYEQEHYCQYRQCLSVYVLYL